MSEKRFYQMSRTPIGDFKNRGTYHREGAAWWWCKQE